MLNDLINELKNGQMKKFIIPIIFVILLLLFKPWVQVGAGERGIVLNFGAVQDVVLNEGIHFRIPIVQKIIPMDVKIQKANTDAAS